MQLSGDQPNSLGLPPDEDDAVRAIAFAGARRRDYVAISCAVLASVLVGMVAAPQVSRPFLPLLYAATGLSAAVTYAAVGGRSFRSRRPLKKLSRAADAGDQDRAFVSRTLELTAANERLQREVASRAEAERTVKLQKTILQAVSEASPDGIVVVSDEQEVLLSNQRLREMWGIAAETAKTSVTEALAAVQDQLIDPHGSHDLLKHLEDHPDEKRRREVRLRDGRVLDSYTVPIFGSEGERVGRVWFLRDITALKRATEELQTVARHAACILYETKVTARPGWEKDPEGASRLFEWDLRVQDEQAAQQVLPLDVPEGQSYGSAWERSRVAEDLPQMAKVAARALVGGAPSFTQYFRCVDKYGKIRWLYERVNIEKLGPNRWRTFGVCMDVTEFKGIEQALRETEERLYLFIENIPGPTFIKDDRRRVVYLNSAARRVLGDGKPWENLTVFDLFPPEMASEFQRHDDEVARSGRSLLVMESAPTPGGIRHYLVNKFAFRRGTSGNPWIGAVAIDVTERLEAEADVRLQKRLLETLTEGSPIGIILVDPQGKWRLFNPAFVEMFRLPPDVVAAGRWEAAAAHLREQLNDPTFIARTAELIQNTETRVVEALHMRDGRALIRTSVPVRTDDGSFLGRVGFFQDVTQQEQDKDRLRSLAWELSKSEERERRRIAETLHDQVGQTLSLSQIKLQLIKADAPPQQASALDEVCGLIAETLERTRSLTVQLSPPVLYQLGLVPALRWLTDHMLAPRGIRFEFQAGDDGPSAIDDERRLMIFHSTRELLFNIVKHARATHVLVRSWTDGERFSVLVEDNGIGLPTAGTGGLEQGTHFGLFNISERLRHAGGAFQIESERGRFTRARLTVPIGRAPERASV
jgi:PAS domain S-box-containing protein